MPKNTGVLAYLTLGRRIRSLVCLSGKQVSSGVSPAEEKSVVSAWVCGKKILIDE